MNFNMEINSSFEECDRAREQVVELIKKCDCFQDLILFKVSIAIEEALINAIEHGNKGDTTKKIFIEFINSAEKIVVKVKDSGKGFDVKKVKDPTKDDEVSKFLDRGRGTYLINKTMDKVFYNESGNEIIMEKYKN